MTVSASIPPRVVTGSQVERLGPFRGPCVRPASGRSLYPEGWSVTCPPGTPAKEEGTNRYALTLQVFVFAALVIGCSLTTQAQSSLTPLRTFSSAYNGGTHVTVSTRGNIMRFLSPGPLPDIGYEHINGGTVSAGYILCYTHPASGDLVHAFDIRDPLQGNPCENGFRPATAQFYTGDFPLSHYCVVTRNTCDNVLQLAQTIVFDANMDGPWKRLRVRMTLTNRTNSPVSVDVLRRQVDFNIDSGGTDGWADSVNYHAATGNDGVFAWNEPAGAPTDRNARSHGMILRSITGPSVVNQVDTVLAKVTADPRDTSCNPANIAALSPEFGDYGETLQYDIGTLSPGQSKIVQTEYARFYSKVTGEEPLGQDRMRENTCKKKCS